MLLGRALNLEEKQAITACVFEPDQVIARRFAAKATLADAARKLEPQRIARASQLPGNSPDGNLHFPLMFWAANTLGYKDDDLVNDLFTGMPIAGPIKPSPSLTERTVNASVTLDQWKEAIPERNKANAKRVMKSQNPPAANACYEKTMDEVKAGWLSVPIPLSQADPFMATNPQIRSRRTTRGPSKKDTSNRRFPRIWFEQHGVDD